MARPPFAVILIFLQTLVISCPLSAQSWDFIKEKDGIKIYTCTETGKPLKSYKGVADIHAPSDKVFALIEDVNNTDWWDKNFSQIKVLLYEKYKHARYYLVYQLPWPVTNRDLCVDVTVTTDPVSGTGTITALPLPGVVPEKPGLVRIKEYRQTWTVRPMGKDQAHVELVGYIDPAGDIPGWISNLLIVDSPLKVIGEVKKRMER